MKKFYNEQDNPTSIEKLSMWNEVSNEITEQKTNIIKLHWKSFWFGQAAAVLLALAIVGLISTVQKFNEPATPEEQYKQALQSASSELSAIPDLIISQASEQKRPKLESTVQGIEEIDRLLEELRDDMIINGSTPVKELQMKRLYATKLDFYKEILLNNEDQL